MCACVCDKAKKNKAATTTKNREENQTWIQNFYRTSQSSDVSNVREKQIKSPGTSMHSPLLLLFLHLEKSIISTITSGDRQQITSTIWICRRLILAHEPWDCTFAAICASLPTNSIRLREQNGIYVKWMLARCQKTNSEIELNTDNCCTVHNH